MAITKLVADSLGVSAVPNQSAFKNIIINGDMNISQRGTSFADLNGVGLDRFRFDKVNDGAVTVSQETDVPSGQGFSKSLKVDVTTADTSIGSSQYGQITQRIEAQNLQYLKYGTTNAETLTLTFWVKSNKTGTYCVSIVKIDNTRYDYIAEYSISSANTWEKKTITIAPDSNIKASGGAIDNNNDVGFYFSFILANGSGRQGTNETWNTSTPATSTSNQVNLLDSTSNEWYLTGVQLEAGTSASDFEFLPFDVNQQRCQRYFVQYGKDLNGAGTHIVGVGQWYSASEVVYCLSSPVRMRTKPTMTTPTVSNGYRFHKAGAYTDVSDGGAIDNCDNQSFGILKQSLSGGTGGQATFVTTQSTGAKLQFSAEL